MHINKVIFSYQYKYKNKCVLELFFRPLYFEFIFIVEPLLGLLGGGGSCTSGTLSLERTRSTLRTQDSAGTTKGSLTDK